MAGSYYAPPGGAPPGGYGAPPPGYGAPPPGGAGGYGAPPPGYGAPPGGAGGYGAPPPGYGAPPPGGAGRGGPAGAPAGAYGGPPAAGAGGAPPGAYGGPPPGGHWIQSYGGSFSTVDHLRHWFATVDKDRSGTISDVELAEFRGPGMDRPAGPKLALRMVRVFDKDKSTSIDFNEFVMLYRFLEAMHKAFVENDRNRNGRLDSNEIHAALMAGGFKMLNIHAIHALFRKYDTERKGEVTFIAFLEMAIDVALIRTKFDSLARGQPYASINLDGLIQAVADV